MARTRCGATHDASCATIPATDLSSASK
jgi:hypothetical protein